MFKPTLAFAILLVTFIAQSRCQRFIQPTYRPPPRRPVSIRTVRETCEPQCLYQGDLPRAPVTGDHPYLPPQIDDIHIPDPNRRYARSLSTPSFSHRGGSRPATSRDTGPTHPGYNRRNARDIRFPEPTPLNPNAPRPQYPWNPKPKYPIYARSRREASTSDSQEDLRSERSIDEMNSQELGEAHSQGQVNRRVARDIWIPDPTPFNPNAPRPQYPCVARTASYHRDYLP